MGGGIVVAGYWNPAHAMTHARCLTGCTTSTIDIDQLRPELRALVENQILSELPEDIRKDIEIAEWEEEDQTPEVQMTVDELDDAISDGVPKPVGFEISSDLSIDVEPKNKVEDGKESG